MKRDLFVVTALALAAQAAGFLKSILIARYFGLSSELDGYYLSQVPLSLVVGVTVGALQTGFIPEYARLKTAGDTRALASLRGGFLCLVASGGLVISLVISVWAPEVAYLLAPHAVGAVRTATVESLRVLAFVLCLHMIAEYLAMVLQAEIRFLAAAVAPIANAVLSAAVLWRWPQYGLATLIWGTLLGWVVHLVIVLVALVRARFHGGFSVLHLGRSLGRVLRPAAAILPGVSASTAGLTLPLAFAATVGPGAVSALAFAQRLHGSLTQTLGMANAAVLLPHFSARAADGRYGDIVSTLRRGLLWLWVISLVVVMGVWLAGRETLTLLFERGRFGATAVTSVYGMWIWLSLGLFFSLWNIVLTKYFQAVGRARLISWVAVIGLVVLVVSTFGLIPILGAPGVAAGILIASFVSTVLLQVVCHRDLTNKGVPYLFLQRRILGITLAVLVAGGLAFVVKLYLMPVAPLP